MAQHPETGNSENEPQGWFGVASSRRAGRAGSWYEAPLLARGKGRALCAGKVVEIGAPDDVPVDQRLTVRREKRDLAVLLDPQTALANVLGGGDTFREAPCGREYGVSDCALGGATRLKRFRPLRARPSTIEESLP